VNNEVIQKAIQSGSVIDIVSEPQPQLSDPLGIGSVGTVHGAEALQEIIGVSEPPSDYEPSRIQTNEVTQ
jgi:hypothetical protein